MNRSSCASGSGNVPSWSTGFWVAMTIERLLEIVGRAIDRDTALGHRFQQRRLGPRCGPIDFVGQQDLSEHRSSTELELGRFLVED